MRSILRRVHTGVFSHISLVTVALIAALTSFPGMVPADTKLYLYLNPGRLISDAPWSWDMRFLGGWVPHQNVGYLWPTGPFFYFFELIDVPDWIAHRLWIATLMAIAGISTARLARFMGLGVPAAFLAGLAYQFSPYVLPYISRTSALLLPWCLLPWLVHLASKYALHRRVRDLVVFGLIVASSGGLNATALLMVAPAPLIWMFVLLKRQGHSFTRIFSPIFQVGLVSVGVSVWWLAGLFVQGRFGAAVLSYSEALVSTSATSSAPEVLRGLGYWLFYDRGPVAPLTTASDPYQSSLALISLGAGLVVIGMVGVMRAGRWRSPLGIMLVTGLVLSVGAHPFADSSPLFDFLADNPRSSLSLALRSSSRAVPLVVLAVAIGIGFAWDCYAPRVRRNRIVSLSLVALVIIANLPAAVNGDLADRALLRPEQLPEAWNRAADYLDDRYDAGHTGAVLLVPGIESAAYRWGYPVDAILPGLTKKPLLTRDWLPLGSPALMDLLYALDDSFQNGTANPNSIAPVARLLGADTVMFVSSHQYERFDSARPARSHDVFDPVPPGLTFLESFGDRRVNVPPAPIGSRPVWDSENIAFPPIELPEILLYAVDDAVSAARLFDEASIIAADGTGLVDLASSDAISGNELLLSEASLPIETLDRVMSDASTFLITDSNRRRAHHWRGSQDVWGATEPLSGVVTVADAFDSRLPIHPGQDSQSETIIEDAPIEALASLYGAELRYQPEYRPRMAVDGDPMTSWKVPSGSSSIGSTLTLRSANRLSSLLLLQDSNEFSSNRILRVSIRTEGSSWKSHELTDSSLSSPGQRIPVSPPAQEIQIRIDGVLDEDDRSLSNGVGFREVVDLDLSSPEVVRLPERLAPPSGSTVAYSLTRLRSDPYDRARRDPEQHLLRRLPLAMDSIDAMTAEVRLDPKADDAMLGRILGVDDGFSDRRLQGNAQWWGPAAFDGDPETAWWSPLPNDAADSPSGSFTRRLEQPMRWIEVMQDVSPVSSRIRTMRIEYLDDNRLTGFVDIDVSSDGRILLAPRSADAVNLRILDVDASTVFDPHTDQEVAGPVSIAEIRSDAWANEALPTAFDTGCRNDLLEIGGSPVPVRLTGNPIEALSGDPIRFEACSLFGLRISAGSLLRTPPGRFSGLNIDRLVIVAGSRPAFGGVEPLDFRLGRTDFSTEVSACPQTCWLEAPFGASRGWTASIDGADLNTPIRSAAGRSLWQLSATPSGVVSAAWTPQIFLWWGLAISGTVILVLIAVWGFDRKRHGRSHPATHEQRENRWQESHISSIRIALLGALASSVIVEPLWGAAVGAAFLVFPRYILARLSIAAVAIGYLFVILQQLRVGADPGFGWPSVFERAHKPMMASVLVFALSLVGKSRIPDR